MKSHASSAMVKGLIAQLTKRVTAMPRQCTRTSRKAPKSIFISIGTIISQTSSATGRLTCASVAWPSAAKGAGENRPSAIPARMHSATHSER